ncbi:segregation/condensation protein A [Actinomyces sp. B33]|uniref:segregation and condensation protein A n=1 Tax=Actinomyces sp. B33 TaxID=2942131 RepID=UPI0023416C08|nr:ScpA family protein [Actinomyces sp. B33]MDC4233292.1 segregation/condensation protein A [Actinomyces sp. B33]
MATPPDAGVAAQVPIDEFQVALDVFEGPFDLLLQLIARKKLDITEVALSEVTDEFIAHMRLFPDLSRTTEFLVVAATLLDMKAAQLLPSPEGADDLRAEDLEARDLLFSRLLQYRAFKMAAARIEQALDSTSRAHPRHVPLEPHFAQLLPELVWVASPEDLARVAAEALSSQPPTVAVAHLHDPVVPVREQALIVSRRLRAAGRATFHDLVADAASTAVVVSRFLALLELFRRGAVEFIQEEALGKLTISWTGGDEDVDVDVDDDYGAHAPGKETRDGRADD